MPLTASRRTGGHDGDVWQAPRAFLLHVLAAAAFAVPVVGCGDEKTAPTASPTTEATGSGDVDASVQAACDRLAELGTEILDVRGAQSPADVRAGVEEPFAAFVDAAEKTGDERLIDLANRAQSRFEVYVTSPDGLDSREAGDDFDIALDRSGLRCIELGAAVDFPHEPG